MKVVLCIKQVPDTTDIKWTENNTIRREGLESVINPYDIYAMENVLSLKRKYNNVSITALSMGPLQAKEMLRKTIAIGVDNAFLLCDKKFAGADTYATSKTIAAAIKSKLSDFDLIVCGQFAVDGDTAQTGPSIANFLDIPHITYVKKVLEADSQTVTLLRELDDGEEIVKVKLPALICVLQDTYEPARALISGVKAASLADIPMLTLEDIALDAEQVGLKGSPTYVSKAFRAPKRSVNCEFIEAPKELAETLKAFGGSDA